MKGLLSDREIQELVDLRHNLHIHPHTAGHEEETRKILKDFLCAHTSFLPQELGESFYLYCPSPASQKAPVAFRADFDALPLAGRADLPYASKNPGISHQCGHDGHSAVLAGLALLLNRQPVDRPVYLLFQQGEEVGIGGREASRFLDEKGVEAVYAFHNRPGYPEGSLLVKEGIIQCASEGLTLSFQGQSSHASEPELGRNPAKLMADLLQFISHFDKSQYEGPIWVTPIHAQLGRDRDFGINPGQGSLSFTLRAYYDEDLKKLEREIKDRAERGSREAGLSLKSEISDFFPAVVNHPGATAKVRRAAKKAGLPLLALEEAWRASEDFGWYGKTKDAAMFFVGSGEKEPPLHSSAYDFNDAIIPKVVSVFWAILQEEPSHSSSSEGASATSFPFFSQ